LPVVVNLGADIAGLRGAACINGDRVEGTITRQLVKELVEIVRDAEMHAQVERV
jgi:(5-formylfuran-3-yl)methyl phosphate synthase